MTPDNWEGSGGRRGGVEPNRMLVMQDQPMMLLHVALGAKALATVMAIVMASAATIVSVASR